MNIFRKKRGFTLLELMIVVIIIGILASLAIPRFIRATLRARSAEALTNLGMLRSSEWRYYMESASSVFTGNFTFLDIDNPNLLPNVKFTYTIPTATASALSIKAEYKLDTSKYITMDKDGNITRTGL
ncbi:MAG: prepilin-type N-terminal cleavage/methylation domain-containing protein [Omnitrophica bacterium]|nr:prepilin-type N-terminal cleavage/methylation domain-containing protein [Candidatus Omnitrophota bacterium]